MAGWSSGPAQLLPRPYTHCPSWTSGFLSCTPAGFGALSLPSLPPPSALVPITLILIYTNRQRMSGSQTLPHFQSPEELFQSDSQAKSQSNETRASGKGRQRQRTGVLEERFSSLDAHAGHLVNFVEMHILVQ